MSKQKSEPISVTFLGAFPSIQSAIKVGSDGMRISIDIPESEMGNAVRLLAMREMVLRVTITPDEQQDVPPPKTDKPSAKSVKVVTGDFEMKR